VHVAPVVVVVGPLPGSELALARPVAADRAVHVVGVVAVGRIGQIAARAPRRGRIAPGVAIVGLRQVLAHVPVVVVHHHSEHVGHVLVDGSWLTRVAEVGGLVRHAVGELVPDSVARDPVDAEQQAVFTAVGVLDVAVVDVHLDLRAVVVVGVAPEGVPPVVVGSADEVVGVLPVAVIVEVAFGHLASLLCEPEDGGIVEEAAKAQVRRVAARREHLQVEGALSPGCRLQDPPVHRVDDNVPRATRCAEGQAPGEDRQVVGVHDASR
jgi:hypothetical protein